MVRTRSLQRRVRASKEEENDQASEDSSSVESFSEDTSGNSGTYPIAGIPRVHVEQNERHSNVFVGGVDEVPEPSDDAGDDFDEEIADESDEDFDDEIQDHKEQVEDFEEDLEEHPGSGSESSSADNTDPQQTIASISFGALASAQASLNRKRKRDSAEPSGSANKQARSPSPFHEEEERKAGRKIPLAAVAARSSKHAPTELSSKKAVSRKRQIVDAPRMEARDPRFSSLSGTLDVNRVSQKYAFLNDYRASEIADLKRQARDTKDAKTKEALKKQLKSMEDREQARRRAEEEKDVIRRHRKEERERIKEGKKPFFLKKGEIKKQALVKRFEGMGEKKAEKAVEKRRKRKAKKEKKAMPRSRRMVD